MLRLIDRTHAALAQHLQQLIVPQPLRAARRLWGLRRGGHGAIAVTVRPAHPQRLQLLEHLSAFRFLRIGIAGSRLLQSRHDRVGQTFQGLDGLFAGSAGQQMLGDRLGHVLRDRPDHVAEEGLLVRAPGRVHESLRIIVGWAQRRQAHHTSLAVRPSTTWWAIARCCELGPPYERSNKKNGKVSHHFSRATQLTQPVGLAASWSCDVTPCLTKPPQHFALRLPNDFRVAPV